ncbi:MAG: hypothetical protein M3413_07165 [Bacteroidota bacterium]|nr:hypothetical protein [Bacteroidota bacterium]
MRQQLSHEYPFFVPVKLFGIGVAVGTILFWLLGFYSSGSGRVLAIVVPLIMGLGASYYSVQFFNVSFDENFIYFSRFGQEEKLRLDSVTDIKVTVFPLRIFYLNTYILTIEYIEHGQLKKIKCISKGIPRILSSVREIPHLDTFQKYIKDKRYSSNIFL